MTPGPFRRLLIASLAGAMVAGSVGRSSQAADGQSATGSGGQAAGDALTKMRAMRAWRIVDELRLDEKTAGRMVAVLGAYDEREIALLAERHDITYELQEEETAAHPDDSRLLRTIDRLTETRSRIYALHTERFAALRKVLAPVQQAKLLLFLPRLERQLARSAHDADAGQREAY